MFERIKCYLNLRKSDKMVREIRQLAELEGDAKLMLDCSVALYKNSILRNEMWFNRRMAESYNSSVMEMKLTDIEEV